uniref:Uncharacterized protein n=1 Tax=Plectus sambesii TaxID=2011161 RepID=A0A914V8Z9_9BILA
MVPRSVVAYPVATGLNVARALSSSAKHNGSVAARFFSLSVHSLSVESAAASQRCRPRMGLHEAEPNDQDDQKDGQHFGAKGTHYHLKYCDREQSDKHWREVGQLGYF